MRLGIICCVLVVAGATAFAALAKPAAKPSEFALAKEYLFAACVSAQYKGKEIGKEAEVWAGGIVENGNQDAAGYGEIANLAKTLAPPPDNTMSGTLMRLKSCLRLYDSRPNPGKGCQKRSLHKRYDRAFQEIYLHTQALTRPQSQLELPIHFDVMFEGKNVCRMGDPLFHNDKNGMG